MLQQYATTPKMSHLYSIFSPKKPVLYVSTVLVYIPVRVLYFEEMDN